jgi:acyl-CoA reductase-like NAD-dependent aldehyde dehydrogenase
LIIPWNNPLASSCLKIGGALAAGNTVVVKPPSWDALSTLLLGEICAELGLPEGTINIVTGPGSTAGTALASHPDVNMISFTGSSETGKAILTAASYTVKRTCMELGGKNPFIVLEDADLDQAVEKAVTGTHRNSGQVCASPGRYYIHEKLHDEFVGKYIEGAKRIVVGDPLNPGTMMGPVVSAEHRDRIEKYIKSGIAEGAKLMLGKTRPAGKGYYVLPTVLINVTQSMVVAREEIFGPVACILKFSDENKVIEMANDTRYGLCASVFTKNDAKGMRFANSIQAGAVYINDTMLASNDLPWGGYKESGIGKENGIIGLLEYTQMKTITLNVREK